MSLVLTDLLFYLSMQGPIRSATEIGGWDVGAFKAKFLGSHLPQVGLGSGLKHVVGDVATQLLQEGQLVSVLVAWDYLEDKYSLLEFLRSGAERERKPIRNRNHALEAKLRRKRAKRKLAKQQKNGHHAISRRKTRNSRQIITNEKSLNEIKLGSWISRVGARTFCQVTVFFVKQTQTFEPIWKQI